MATIDALRDLITTRALAKALEVKIEELMDPLQPMTALEAGPALDALVAEKIFGPSGVYVYEGDLANASRMTIDGVELVEGDRVTFSTVPPYSTDIAAAWEVVEKLQELGCNHFSLDWEQPYDDRPRRQREAGPRERPWMFAFNAPRHLSGTASVGMPYPITLHAPSAPLAICYGALIAVGAAYVLGTDIVAPDNPSH